ncbi:hypothetical protein L218DRAFT_948335 [Marasmius fiardii PR-910]|nr:hypothetical protein L218DRAFT_948335 [Marasmius fiardii PR-910]
MALRICSHSSDSLKGSTPDGWTGSGERSHNEVFTGWREYMRSGLSGVSIGLHTDESDQEYPNKTYWKRVVKQIGCCRMLALELLSGFAAGQVGGWDRDIELGLHGERDSSIQGGGFGQELRAEGAEGCMSCLLGDTGDVGVGRMVDIVDREIEDQPVKDVVTEGLIQLPGPLHDYNLAFKSLRARRRNQPVTGKRDPGMQPTGQRQAVSHSNPANVGGVRENLETQDVDNSTRPAGDSQTESHSGEDLFQGEMAEIFDREDVTLSLSGAEDVALDKDILEV